MGESMPMILRCQINTLPSVPAWRIDGVSITMCGFWKVHAFVQKSPKDSKSFLEICLQLILILLLFMTSLLLEKERRMWDVLFPSIKFWPCDIWYMYMKLLKLVLYCIFWVPCLVFSSLFGLVLLLSPSSIMLLRVYSQR